MNCSYECPAKASPQAYIESQVKALKILSLLTEPPLAWPLASRIPRKSTADQRIFIDAIFLFVVLLTLSLLSRAEAWIRRKWREVRSVVIRCPWT